MKVLLATGIAGLLLCSSGVRAEPIYQGTFEVYKTRGACQPGESLGTIGNLRFEQSALGTGLTFAQPSEARSYFLQYLPFDATFRKVDSMYVRFGFSPVPHTVKVRFIRQVPASITDETQTIRVIGEVKGFTTATCVSKFRATLVRWLDL